MRTKTLGGAIVWSALFMAFGQGSTPPQSQNKAAFEGKLADGNTDGVRLFYLTHGETAQETQEFVNLIRTVAEVQRASSYFERRTVAVRGTADQIALAEWLFARLDKPVDTQPAKTASYDFPLSTGQSEPVRVFYVGHYEPPENLQQIVNLMRTITEVPRIFAYGPRRAIVTRGTPAQTAVAEWLFGMLDKGTVPQTTRVESYEEAGGGPQPPSVRLFFVPSAETGQQLQEMVTVIRTTSDARRVGTYSPLRVIALRGSPTEAALAEWLIRRMSAPAGDQPRPK